MDNLTKLENKVHAAQMKLTHALIKRFPEGMAVRVRWGQGWMDANVQCVNFQGTVVVRSGNGHAHHKYFRDVKPVGGS